MDKELRILILEDKPTGAVYITGTGLTKLFNLVNPIPISSYILRKIEAKTQGIPDCLFI